MTTSSTDNNLIDLENASLYNNRELSWLAFNKRVLEEATDTENALLERYKFLSIFSSNLDEFFMVRVAGLLDQVKAGYNRPENKAGLTPKEQLAAISEITHTLVEKQDDIYTYELSPLLAKEHLKFVPISKASSTTLSFLETFFDREIFPILTPMAVDAYRPFPMLLNKSLNLAIRLEQRCQVNTDYGKSNNEKLALVQVPAGLNRYVELPEDEGIRTFVLVEQIIVKLYQASAAYVLELRVLVKILK
jgi:polyphosphate kinase